MLDRHALATQFQGVAQRLEGGFLEWAVELHIEGHAGALELVGHQHLHVAPRVRDPALLQIESAFVDGFENRVHEKTAMRWEKSRPYTPPERLSLSRPVPLAKLNLSRRRRMDFRMAEKWE
jgi:hypothetical protein